MKSKLRVIVLGYIVRGPIGGLAWHHLQYAMGLAALGHDVYFLEDSDDYPSCYDPSQHVTDMDPKYGLRFAEDTFDRVHLGDRWAYYDAHAKLWHRLTHSTVVEICATADLLINVSGMNPIRPWFQRIPVKVLVDTDPVFTQIRHLKDRVRRDFALQHDVFFSFGENIGRPGCTVPDDGLNWMPTRQPIVLDAWSVTPGCEQGRFTTVMQWESYPMLEHEGKRYGMKADSFEPFLSLPQHCDSAFELAIGNPSAPRELLLRHGWAIVDPLEPTKDPWTYQRYIQESKGEFSVAKHGYVTSRSGWFSERSAAYLASGRPVLVQDTGFTEWLPTGAGVAAFVSPQEALEELEQINGHYEFHCRAAREVAEEYFDARKILTRLIDDAMRSVEATSEVDVRGANR